MLYLPFANAAEFQNRFGSPEKRNKKLLSVFMTLVRARRNDEAGEIFRCTYLDFDVFVARLTCNCGFRNRLDGGFFNFNSEKYELDEARGICEDGDFNAIRYVNKESGRVFKMKAGKFFRAVMIENDGLRYGETALNAACELLTEKWKALDASKATLKIDDDFEFLYNSDNYDGGFKSCMSDKGYHYFYADSVSARAASLVNTDGLILSRCVIFDEVKNEDTGAKLRLAERQYTGDGRDFLARALVDALIKAGEIDGYKRIGAGCGDADGFLYNDGSEIEENLSISCSVGAGDIVSYQDSFKWLNLDEQRAYNFDFSGAVQLDVTDGEIEGINWDEYNQEYTSEDLERVNLWSSINHRYFEQYTAESYAHNDFYYYDGEYYDELTYSEVLNEDVPNDKIFDLEDEYKSNYWEWCEFSGEYFPELISVNVWNGEEYEQKECSEEYAEDNFLEYDGEYYDELNEEGAPLDFCAA